MSPSFALGLGALAAFVAAMLYTMRRETPRPDALFWILIVVATLGAATAGAAHLGTVWQTDLSAALWISITASLILFAGVALIVREAWRLAPILLIYLIALGLLATAWGGITHGGLYGPVDAWLIVHIVVSVATYGLCTLAAVAGAAVLLRERALRRKRPGGLGLVRRLPSVADAARLQVGLLTASEVVLAVGIATGMARQYVLNGHLLEFDHKTLLSILAFVVIAGLLVAHRRTGLRGQRAAQVVLVGYLLLTLAYPGVKFVTDVLLA